jgi:hypothetical protein
MKHLFTEKSGAYFIVFTTINRIDAFTTMHSIAKSNCHKSIFNYNEIKFPLVVYFIIFKFFKEIAFEISICRAFRLRSNP